MVLDADDVDFDIGSEQISDLNILRDTRRRFMVLFEQEDNWHQWKVEPTTIIHITPPVEASIGSSWSDRFWSSALCASSTMSRAQ